MDDMAVRAVSGEIHDLQGKVDSSGLNDVNGIGFWTEGQ